MGLFGKDMVEGKATILADEGYTGFKVSGSTTAWEHCKYIVEVRPDTGDAFRTETVAKVAYLSGPAVGDVVNCKYDAKSHKVDLLLDGDPRYDPRLKREAEKARQQALLNATPGSTPPAKTYDGIPILDPELQELMDLEEAERTGAAPPPSSSSSAPSSASRLDQLQQLGELRKEGVLSDAEFEQEKARILRET
ncbi:MAG TPA: SHOCT domain-containing protein [Mycobacteriales bacterium]|nr:SHOCT domain-containing protein [Mycobacteriales bacterium]